MAKEYHGERNTRLYEIWASMKGRCNPNSASCKGYGDRGISVCEDWANSFVSFRKWACENGYNPDVSGFECSLDRIDVDGDYCPENCRWTTFKEQERNRRDTHWVEYCGKRMSLAEACEIVNMPDYTVRRRLSAGWQLEDALHTPPIETVRSDLHKKADAVGINYHTVLSRMRLMNWTEEEALEVPVGMKREEYYGKKRD